MSETFFVIVICILIISERIDSRIYAERDRTQLVTASDKDVQGMQGNGSILRSQVKNVETGACTSEGEDVGVSEYDRGCAAGREYEGAEACKT